MKSENLLQPQTKQRRNYFSLPYLILAAIVLFILAFIGLEVQRSYSPAGNLEEKRVTIDATTGTVTKGQFPTVEQINTELTSLYDGKKGYRVIVEYPQDPSKDYQKSEESFDISALNEAYGSDRQVVINDQIEKYPAFIAEAQKPKPQLRRIFWFYDVTEKTTQQSGELMRDTVYKPEELLKLLPQTGDGAQIILCRITGSINPQVMTIVIARGEVITPGKRTELNNAVNWLIAPSDGTENSVVYAAIFNVVSQGLRIGTEKEANPLEPVQIVGVGDTLENSKFLTDTSFYDETGKMNEEKRKQLDAQVKRGAVVPTLGPNATFTWVVPPFKKELTKPVINGMEYMKHAVTLMGIEDPKKVSIQFATTTN